jgi:hypothetical protein
MNSGTGCFCRMTRRAILGRVLRRCTDSRDGLARQYPSPLFVLTEAEGDDGSRLSSLEAGLRRAADNRCIHLRRAGSTLL